MLIQVIVNYNSENLKYMYQCAALFGLIYIRQWRLCRLTARHCLMTQLFFMRPGPPNFLISWQYWQVPHSFLQHAAQRLHLTRLRLRAEMDERLVGLWDLWRVGPKRGRYRTGAGGIGGWYHDGYKRDIGRNGKKWVIRVMSWKNINTGLMNWNEGPNS